MFPRDVSDSIVVTALHQQLYLDTPFTKQYLQQHLERHHYDANTLDGEPLKLLQRLYGDFDPVKDIPEFNLLTFQVSVSINKFGDQYTGRNIVSYKAHFANDLNGPEITGRYEVVFKRFKIVSALFTHSVSNRFFTRIDYEFDNGVMVASTTRKGLSIQSKLTYLDGEIVAINTSYYQGKTTKTMYAKPGKLMDENGNTLYMFTEDTASNYQTPPEVRALLFKTQ